MIVEIWREGGEFDSAFIPCSFNCKGTVAAYACSGGNVVTDRMSYN